jgi:hypothetical protein
MKNKYYSEKEKLNIYSPIEDALIYDKVKKHKNWIIDTLDDDGKITINKILPKDCIKILVYTNLQNLVENIIKRKQPRGTFPFNQFSKYYKKTDNPKDAIDTLITKDEFIKQLKKMKYEFTSEKDLKNFAKDIFKTIGITDNKKHYIKPRHDIYDYILKTQGKTPKQLYTQIKNK